jgi:hypothetical protein
MSSELASLVVIVLIAIGAFIVYKAYAFAQQRKTQALTSPQKIQQWMAAQRFSPDHFSFFHGTAIAVREADRRIVLYRDGAAAIYPATDLTAANAYESLDRGVPRGAAPGVVELNVARRYNLDISLRNAAKPCKILFSSNDLAREWQDRLNALIHPTD